MSDVYPKCQSTEVSYPRMIKGELGESVLHRTNQYINMNKTIEGSSNDMDR